LFTDQKFNDIVGNTADAKALKHELDAMHAIAKAQGTGWARYSVKRPLGVDNKGKPRRVDVIAIRASVLDAALAAKAAA
jgi:hypothetical protein